MMSAIERGEGSKIGRNCQQIVLKSCRQGGGGCQTSEKNADVVYGWSLGCVVKTGHISLLVLLKTVTNGEFQLSQICLKMAFFETLKKQQVSQN